MQDGTSEHTTPPASLPVWRQAERERLIKDRLSLSADERAAIAADIAQELDRMIAPAPGLTISLYWPFKGELDLRGWMATAHDAGARIALPVVVKKAQPLIFRPWSPGCEMTRGVWNIPIPANDEQLVPDVVLSPLVGHDSLCFRLGYGGGFFDRTLAGLRDAGRPARVIGVGVPQSRMPTIRPQPHDIPMDVILTGGGRVLTRAG